MARVVDVGVRRWLGALDDEVQAALFGGALQSSLVDPYADLKARESGRAIVASGASRRFSGSSPAPAFASALREVVSTAGDPPRLVRSTGLGGEADGLVSLETSRKWPPPGGKKDQDLEREYRRDRAERAAWRSAVDGLQVAGVTEYGPLGASVDVEPLPTDLVINNAALRQSRLRSKVLIRSRMIHDRLASSGQRWKAAFVTATYADEDDFDVRQISTLIAHISKWGKRRGFTIPYLWVLERGEKNGRLHYHLIVWLPKGLTLPKPDKQGWWPYGSTNIQWARHPPVGYLAKYVGKGGKPGDPPMPSGARLHGSGGLTMVERLKIAWAHAPGWVREHWPEWESEVRAAVGGGWFSRVTGDWLPSPWRFMGMFRGSPVIRAICAVS